LEDSLEQPTSIGTVYAFEHFRLDKAGRQLVRQGTHGKTTPVLLGSRAFDVLLALVERSGEVVSKTHLLDAVWPGLAVGEVNLTVQISAVRRAIDHGRDGPSLIRTIHGRGYLLAGGVTQEIVTPSPPAVSSPERLLSVGKHLGDGPGKSAVDLSRYPRTLKAAEDTDTDEERPERWTSERRQLTILTCEVVELATLSTQLDLEDLREATTACHACCKKIVERHRGYVASYGGGGGVLAYFGYLQADEHDVERAVRAGLMLVDAVPQLSTAAGVPLHVRVGVATGLVAASNPPGSNAAQTVTVVGDTPNLAMRLQTLAQPDTVVVSQATRSHLGRLFNYRDVNSVKLEGLPTETPVWQVMSENRSFGQFEALRSSTTPLVGRDEEMELLLRRWAQAKAGNGKVVLIAAEPGVGKSRLAEALAERIAAEAYVRLRYFCSPHHQDSALYPVIAQTERAAGFAHGDAPEVRLIKLQASLMVTEPPPEDVALIAQLHGLPPAGLAPLNGLTPQRRKERTFEALLRQLKGLARQHPVVVVFDDLHWIDPSSRELLDRLIERIADWPVLLLALFRPEFQPPWVGQPQVTMLNLTRLDRQDTAAMIANVAGDTALPSEIVKEIAERTDGVPLFVEEVTKAVLETGAPAPAALSAVPHAGLSVPATLHASLMARLDRLGSAAREVAQAGATIGREFGYELLMSIAGLPEPQLTQLLERLVSAGLVFARGTPPEASYLFKHALVQDAAHGSLLRGRRQHLHNRIVVTLEKRFPEIVAAQPALLAQHCQEAGLPEQAVGYWLQAGQQALARSAMAEAATLLRKALSIVFKLPDSLQRQECELDLQIALGQALIATQGFTASAVGKAYTRARVLCEQLKLPDKLLPILYGQWAHYSISDLKLTRQFAAEIRQLSEARDDRVARVMACRASGLAHLYLGDFIAADAYLEEGLALYDPAQRDSHASIYATTDPLVFLWTYSSVVLICCGRLDQARSRSDAVLAYARNLSHAHSLGLALHWAWIVHWCARSESRILLQIAAELVNLSDERDFVTWRPLGAVLRGWCLVESGQPNQGIQLMSDGLAEVRVNGNFLRLTLLLLSRTPTEWPVNRMLRGHLSPRPSSLPKPRKSFGLRQRRFGCGVI
jgi:class 3 adenylate cyclase/DNA-binding winged helix-turn-helix (wHTH) protein/tetratricopeptide (TPR) repeat protein